MSKYNKRERYIRKKISRYCLGFLCVHRKRDNILQYSLLHFPSPLKITSNEKTLKKTGHMIRQEGLTLSAGTLRWAKARVLPDRWPAELFNLKRTHALGQWGRPRPLWWLNPYSSSSTGHWCSSTLMLWRTICQIHQCYLCNYTASV